MDKSILLGASIGPSPATDVELSRCPGDSPNRRADHESAGALWERMIAVGSFCSSYWCVVYAGNVREWSSNHHNRNVIIPATPNPSSNPTPYASNAPVSPVKFAVDGPTTDGLHASLAPGGWVLQETRAGFSRGRGEVGCGGCGYGEKSRDPYPLISVGFAQFLVETWWNPKNIGLMVESIESI